MQKNGYQPKKGNIINQLPSTGSKVSLERKHETSNKYNDIVKSTYLNYSIIPYRLYLTY